MKIQKSRKRLFKTGLVTASLLVVGVMAGVGIIEGSKNVAYAGGGTNLIDGMLTASPSSMPASGGEQITVNYSGENEELDFTGSAHGDPALPPSVWIGLSGSSGDEVSCNDVQVISSTELKCTPVAPRLNRVGIPLYIFIQNDWSRVQTSNTAFTFTDTKFVKGSSIGIKYAIEDFRDTAVPTAQSIIKVDGQVVDSANYSLSTKNTALPWNPDIYNTLVEVTLSSDYLNGLADGVHALYVEFVYDSPSFNGGLPRNYEFIILPAGETPDGLTYTQGSSSGLAYHISKEFTLFDNGAGSVEVDGTVVAPSNYDASEGSTIITLRPSYLNTLSVGSHTFVAKFSDSTTFTRSFNILGNTLPGANNPNASGLTGVSGSANGVVPGVPSTGLRF